MRSYKRQMRSYKKYTNTKNANKLYDKAGEYLGMRRHSLIFA